MEVRDSGEPLEAWREPLGSLWRLVEAPLESLWRACGGLRRASGGPLEAWRAFGGQWRASGESLEAGEASLESLGGASERSQRFSQKPCHLPFQRPAQGPSDTPRQGAVIVTGKNVCNFFSKLPPVSFTVKNV